jgi:hypothetical protein
MTRTITTQLAGYLSDAHAIEEQALAQLRSAPGMAGDDRLAAASPITCARPKPTSGSSASAWTRWARSHRAGRI